MDQNIDQKFGNLEKRELDPLEQAVDLLAEFRPGMTLSIRRLRPTWCSGFLERVECLDGDKIDIDYIINRWGGKVLGIRLLNDRGKLAGSMDLNLSSYPPKFEGRLLNPNDDWRSLDASKAAPPLPNTTDPIKLMKFLQEQRQTDLEQIKTIIAQSSAGQALAPPAPQQNQLQQLIELGKTYKQLQGLFGGNAPVPVVAAPSPENTDLNIMGQITDLLKVLKTPSATTQRAKILPQSPIPNPETQAPQGQNLSAVLSNMTENDYTNLMLTSLQSMPEDKRASIIERFLTVSGLMDEETDDDDDDAEDIENEDSGGAVEPNGDDDPPDWEGN